MKQALKYLVTFFSAATYQVFMVFSIMGRELSEGLSGRSGRTNFFSNTIITFLLGWVAFVLIFNRFLHLPKLKLVAVYIISTTVLVLGVILRDYSITH